MNSTSIKKVLMLVFFIALNGCSKEKKQPNIIIILTDDQGYGDLSCYGAEGFDTPNIDKMAKEGILFTDFYVSQAVCSASRASLMTGSYAERVGIQGALSPWEVGGLDPKIQTIAKLLKSYEYTNAIYGKWHLGHLNKYMPLNHGFDHFYGIPYSNDMRPEGKWDYARNNFPPLPFLDGQDTIGVSLDQGNFIEMFTQRSIDFIRQNKNNPFFLYLAHTAPHTPLVLKEENKGRSIRGPYGDVVEEIDRSVGNILNVLKEQNIAENTFVIFTSDNGPWGWANIDGGSSGLLKGNKGSVYEGGYRVPAIAWMPGSVPQVTTTALASTLDFFPTMINMAGGEYDDQSLNGIDIRKTFFENSNVRTDIHYYRQDTLIALRHKEWKMYIKDPNPWDDGFTQKDMPLLYNVEHDPSEKYNIAKENSEIVKVLNDIASEHIQSVLKTPSQYDEILPSYQSAYNEYNKK